MDEHQRGFRSPPIELKKYAAAGRAVLFVLAACITTITGTTASADDVTPPGTPPAESQAQEPAPSKPPAKAEGEGEVRELIIGIDLSKSNPVVDNADYAQKVAQRVSKMIAPLAFRSEIKLRTFGAFSGSVNTLRLDITLSTRQRPEPVSKDIETLIAGTPQLTAERRLVLQDSTNIIGFLENMAQIVDCKAMPTTIILLSDGIEESEYVSLRKSKTHLPHPTRMFDGCDELQILGIGQGTESPLITDRLRTEWEKWAGEAGFAKFSGLNDW